MRNFALFLAFNFATLLSAQPAIELGAVSQAESADRLMGKLLKTGVHRAVAAGATKQGSWETDAQGGRVYRLRIKSTEAAGLRLHFTGFAVGEGEVSLSQPGTKAQDYARYQGKGPFDDGDFWSHTVEGA